MAVQKEIKRPDRDLVKALAEFGTATLHEAYGKKGAMPFYIKPLYPGMKVCGPALTVAVSPGDNLMIHYAMTLAQPGDVLVVDAKGFTEAGPWGDIMTTAAIVRGIAGLVIDGCVRDAETIREMGFAVFARGTSMKGTPPRPCPAMSTCRSPVRRCLFIPAISSSAMMMAWSSSLLPPRRPYWSRRASVRAAKTKSAVSSRPGKQRWSCSAWTRYSSRWESNNNYE